MSRLRRVRRLVIFVPPMLLALAFNHIGKGPPVTLTELAQAGKTSRDAEGDDPGWAGHADSLLPGRAGAFTGSQGTLSTTSAESAEADISSLWKSPAVGSITPAPVLPIPSGYAPAPVVVWEVPPSRAVEPVPPLPPPSAIYLPPPPMPPPATPVAEGYVISGRRPTRTLRPSTPPATITDGTWVEVGSPEPAPAPKPKIVEEAEKALKGAP